MPRHSAYPQSTQHRGVSISLSHTATTQLEGKITDISTGERVNLTAGDRISYAMASTSRLRRENQYLWRTVAECFIQPDAIRPHVIWSEEQKERRGESECQRFSCRPQALACRLASHRIAAWDNEACRTASNMLADRLLIDLARRLSHCHVGSTPKCKWVTWRVGDAELDSETVWRRVMNDCCHLIRKLS